MDVDSDNELLTKVAAGEQLEKEAWPALRDDMLIRLEKIAHTTFKIPNLPPPSAPETRLLSPLPPSLLDQSSSQEADKENAPAPKPAAANTTAAATTQELEPGALPKQLADMLSDIKTHISSFQSNPPHTIQRLAELVLSPQAHYKALAPYLHAVDRVVQVTSSTDVYPLPLAVPDMSAMRVNGDDAEDPAAAVSWSNSTVPSVGSDEALGGALLTPIPWLSRRSPDSGDENNTPGAQIHSESTETIDGPNGVGSIETVSVSVNGVPSTGHRGVTQGELLRQEQRAGVVPVNQLSRPLDGPTEDEDMEAAQDAGRPMEEEDEEVPHARGPEEIGVDDTGPQSATTSSVDGDGGVNPQGMDLEAAVGRKHEEEAAAPQASADAPKSTEPEDEAGAAQGEDDDRKRRSPSVESIGTKRDAEQDLEGQPPKKSREIETGEGGDDAAAPSAVESTQTDETADKAVPTAEKSGGSTKSGDGDDAAATSADKMDVQ